MSNLTKKVVAVATALMLSVTIVSPSFAATEAELQAQIDALLAQIAALQQQIAALTGGTPSAGVPAACSGVTFTENLSVGSTGAAVKCLQALLNQSADTQVAASGPGSSGNETTYFGPLTKAAVVKFQEKYAAEILTPLGLTAGTGFVGPSTRAKLNALLTPPPAEEEEEAPPAEEEAPPAEEEEEVVPEEGYITASLYPVPVDTTIYLGTNDNSVYGFEVKAFNSDITIKRVTLNFNRRPWLYVNYLTLYEGDNAVKGVEVTPDAFEEVTAGSSYNLHLTGLNVPISKGTSKVFTLKVNVPSAISGSGGVEVKLIANGVRGVDTAGLNQYAPSSELTPARTFTVSTGVTGALEVSLNTGSPTEGVAIVNTSDVTPDVELAKIDLKAKYSDITITQIKLTGSDHTSNGIATVLPAVTLYDGTTVLQTVAGAASMTFDLSTNPVKITKDATKTLTVKATVAKLDDNDYTKAGDYVSITLVGNTTNITAEDANYNTPSLSGTANGYNIHFYDKAPVLTLKDTSITSVEGSSAGSKAANWSIKIDIKALGGDVYIRKYDDSTSTDSGLVAEKINSSVGNDLAFTISSTAAPSTNGNWVIYNGETKTFTVSGYLPNGGSAGMNGVNITKVRWNTDDSSTWESWIWSSIPLIFKTDQVYIST